MTHSNLALFAAVALSGVASSALAQRTSDPLQPIVRCIERGPFLLSDSSRLPESVASRSVVTADGPRQVSMGDGYRLLLLTPAKLPFVNLKIEKSREGLFEADRRAVMAQMETFSARRSADQRELQTHTLEGVEVLSLDQPSLDKPGPLSFYTLFSARSSIVATAYILNQAPDVREFKTIAEYASLRDRFVNALVSCIAAA